MKAKELSDKELINLIKKGSEDAFSKLHKKYNALIRNVIYKKFYFQHEEVEEILSDTWVKFKGAIQKGQYKKEKAKVSTYVGTIAKNLAIDIVRDKNRPSREIERSSFLQDDTTWKIISNKQSTLIVEDHYYEQLELVKNTLPKIKPFWSLILTVLMDGLPYAEIAEKHNKPLGTIKSEINRAKNGLRLLVFKKAA